jgi:1,4-dihydroxy-2-naphthoate octaprenyltransferase
MIVLGAYFVQTGQLSAPLLHLSFILGLLVSAFLWINQFPDYRADRDAGKRNLVVRLGLRRATHGYVTLLATAYLWFALVLLTDSSVGSAWPGLLGLPAAVFSANRLARYSGDASSLIPAQAAALASFCLFALGAGLGYQLLA